MSNSDHSKPLLFLSHKGFRVPLFSNIFSTRLTLYHFLPSRKVETTFNLFKVVVDFVEKIFFANFFQLVLLK